MTDTTAPLTPEVLAQAQERIHEGDLWLSDSEDLLREVKRLRALSARLAVTVLTYAHDAHPSYPNTTGWRGGPGGAAITAGCSVINPPPGDEGALWELEVPTGEARNVLREMDVDYQSVREELRAAWADELAGFMQKPKATT